MMRWRGLLGLLLLFAAPAWAANYQGDFATGATVYCSWSTNAADGASITRSTNGTLKVFKNGSTTERTSLNGITQTEDFDTDTGIHWIAFDTSDNTDAGFWAAGSEINAVMTAMVIDGKSVAAPVCSWSIERANGAIALLKARTPNAAAGASGGLLISGSNAGTTTLGALTVTGAFTVGSSSGFTFSASGSTILSTDALVTNSTSVIYNVFIAQADGLGMTGLTSASSGLAISYSRIDQGNAVAASITPVAATRGTYTSGGFVEKDATKQPGMYEFGIPNASIASGTDFVTFYFRGVTGMRATVLSMALVTIGLEGIDLKLGTPTGANMAADQAAIKIDTAAIKTKTDGLAFTGAAVQANTGTNPVIVGTNNDKTGYAVTGFPRKNVAGYTYPFYLVSSSGHLTGATGRTVSIEVVKDNAAPVTIAGGMCTTLGTPSGCIVLETGGGWYLFTPAATDVNCNSCAYKATAAGADDGKWLFQTTQ